MVTPFALLVQRGGLSQREAAAYLDLSASSIDKMARGVRTAPSGVLADLRALIARIDRAAAEALAEILRAPSGAEVEIGYAVDDEEAMSLDWPCVGAHLAVLREIVAGAPDHVVIRLVPRGSTPATAAATDAREGRR
ncbi:hypothetical protein [Inquilinus sp. CA228]|uniref:hypothetical protein n=1 Tax=Inquilinus sp. CA228 TaxID=3455609 RepID=UPI003F8D021C